jgi:hypothetical protein
MGLTWEGFSFIFVWPVICWQGKFCSVTVWQGSTREFSATRRPLTILSTNTKRLVSDGAGANLSSFCFLQLIVILLSFHIPSSPPSCVIHSNLPRRSPCLRFNLWSGKRRRKFVLITSVFKVAHFRRYLCTKLCLAGNYLVLWLHVLHILDLFQETTHLPPWINLTFL